MSIQYTIYTPLIKKKKNETCTNFAHLENMSKSILMFNWHQVHHNALSKMGFFWSNKVHSILMCCHSTIFSSVKTLSFHITASSSTVTNSMNGAETFLISKSRQFPASHIGASKVGFHPCYVIM